MEAVIVKQLERHPAYKNSGVEWLGDIPENWKVEKLKNISKHFNSNVDKLSKATEIPVRLCNYVDVYYNDFITDSISFIPATATRDEVRQYKIRIGDVILTKDSEDWLDIGVPAFVKYEAEDLICGYHLAILRPRESTDGAFIFYSLLSSSSKYQLSINANGITRYGLPQIGIKNVVITHPPKKEQTAIANFLGEKCGKIDTAIAQKQKLIELLKERKQILIQNAVTKGLDPDVKMKDSGVEWIGEIPEHWEVKKITHLFSKIGSGTTPTSGDMRYYDGPINFLQTGDLNDGLILSTNRTLKEKALKEFSSLKVFPASSLVIAMYGATIGKLGILGIETTTNQACCVLGDSDKVNINFIFNSFLGFRKEIVSMGYGGGQPNISQDLIRSLRFPVPLRIQEQNSIVEYINKETRDTDMIIEVQKKQIQKLKEYKSTLIDAAVTGKIKVS